MNLFVLQREYCALDTWTRIEDLDCRFCREYEKSLTAHKVTRTHCIRTIHVLNSFIFAIVIPSIRDECVKHRHCSHKFHSCLLRKNCFCGVGEFHDGQN